MRCNIRDIVVSLAGNGVSHNNKRICHLEYTKKREFIGELPFGPSECYQWSPNFKEICAPVI